MSNITGTGYGSTHTWQNKGTEQMPQPQDRSTLWVCKNCDAAFRHYYHIFPDIFQAIKLSKVEEFCPNIEEVNHEK